MIIVIRHVARRGTVLFGSVLFTNIDLRHRLQFHTCLTPCDRPRLASAFRRVTTPAATSDWSSGRACGSLVSGKDSSNVTRRSFLGGLSPSSGALLLGSESTFDSLSKTHSNVAGNTQRLKRPFDSRTWWRNAGQMKETSRASRSGTWYRGR